MEYRGPRLQYLTDEFILQFSGSNVLHTYKDTNEKVRTELRTITGGPLDAAIFGSCFSNQCNCGNVRKVGTKCDICQSQVLPEVKAWQRYARIDLPIFYCNIVKRPNFIKFLETSFNFSWDVSEEFSKICKVRKGLQYEYLQFSYDEENKCIVGTDKITDHDLCGYEGLLAVIISHYPDKLGQFKSYLNTTMIVTPLPLRAPKYSFEGGGRSLINSSLTISYIAVLRIFESDRQGRWIGEYKRLMDSCSTEAEKSMVNAILRKYVANVNDTVSGLLQPSKQNTARTMQSHRLSNSGRCTIIPAPDLNVDEVYIPRHLMYECCTKEFINYMMTKMDWSYQFARTKYIKHATDPEIQELFDEYIENCNDGKGKYVIVNRNPTLYELGMMACRVKLTNNYTIGLPLLLCSPTGGDYDGDTFSFYAIPEALTDKIIQTMSPKNLRYYKKNLSPLFTPSHEIMSGIMVGTRVYAWDGDMKEFDSIEDANKERRTNRKFKWQTPFILNLGDRTKITTLGRYKFGEIFNVDLDEMLNDFDKGGYLTSKEIPELYEGIMDLDDRVDRIQAAQELALTITTTSGGTAPRLSDLHAKLDPKYLEEIRKIEAMDILTDKEKDIKIRAIYDEFLKDTQSGKYIDEEGNEHYRVDPELKLQISDSSRAKVSQLLNIIMPQLTVTPDHQVSVGSTTLIGGMSQTDYVNHSIENRGTQDIKVSATPRSGYTTRQQVLIAEGYTYSNDEDPDNPGILIPKKLAAGRTTTDGVVISKSDASHAKKGELVRVRSVITRTNKSRPIVTSDCISKYNNWKDGAQIGQSLLSSLTEGLTQAGLSLKHGGRLFETDPIARIYAPDDCTLRINDMCIILTSLKGGKEYIYPKPSNFVQNYTQTNTYKKGELVGVAYKQFTPAYRLDCIIKLIRTIPTSSRKKAINNSVLLTECYAYESGEIKYDRHDNRITGVTIGNYHYSYSPNALYFLPEGTKVEKGERFCTGTVDMTLVARRLHDYAEVFQIFYKQFNELIPNIQPELIEFVFSIIITYNEGRISVHNVSQVIANSFGTFNKMAFRNSREVLKKINTSGLPFHLDSISSQLLPSLMLSDQYNE